MQSNNEAEKDFSQIWKFKEVEEADPTSKLLDSVTLESTKDSPTERSSNDPMDIDKIL